MCETTFSGADSAAQRAPSSTCSSVSDENKVHSIIAGMATGTPQYKMTQDQALALAIKCPTLQATKPLLDRIYGNTRIQHRYMAVPDFTPEQADGEPNFYPEDMTFRVPIDVRMQKFYDKALPLVTDVARRAIVDASLLVSDISKVILVSSTGIMGPGLDCALVESLGLERTVDRELIGFMGCAASIMGFRSARDYVLANPGKHSLMICVELSSVHMAPQDDVSNAITHAIFSDGCAATVLSGVTKATCPKGALAIADSHAYLIEGSKDDIQLHFTPNSIVAKLSKFVPTRVLEHTGSFVDALLDKSDLSREDVDFWCVHPGGRRVVEEAEKALNLTEKDTADSWDVLNDFGNMTSPTVMFVLQRVWQRHNKALEQNGESEYKTGVAFGFSPGMGAEGLLLKQIFS